MHSWRTELREVETEHHLLLEGSLFVPPNDGNKNRKTEIRSHDLEKGFFFILFYIGLKDNAMCVLTGVCVYVFNKYD